MKILVCGGRDYKERTTVYLTLYNLCNEFGLWTEEDEYGNRLPHDIHIIAGAARGADSIAIDWAVVNWTYFTEYPADWDTHGKAAGPIRNQQMLDEGKPDMVVAFPGGRGTEDMVRRAKKAGIPVREISNGNS